MKGRRTWSPEKGRQPSVHEEDEGEPKEEEEEEEGEEVKEGGEEGSLTRCLGRLRMTISPS